MTTTIKSKAQSYLEKPLFATLVINWEIVLYALIFVVAMTTRFYDLGARVMSHDESLHALYSFKLYNGEGYTHDPLMHGPLQFHLVALAYLIFGDNDFSARIPAALFGVALVMLPIWFRPWLGRLGALVASFGLLISPLLLYYDRYIRNESFIAFFTALLALSLFQFMRTRKQVWLYAGAVAVALSLSTKEVAFIHGFIGVVFIAAAFAWEKLSLKRFRQMLIGLLVITAVLFVLMIFFNASAGVEDGGIANASKFAGILMMLTGLLLGVLTIALNVDRQNKPIASTLASFANWNTAFNLLIGPILLAAALFFLLHTTFFTNPAGFVSGTWGAVSYWLKQQEVARGGQPGYYYLMLMPMYEFLPFFLGGIGGLVYLFKKAPSFGDTGGQVGRWESEQVSRGAGGKVSKKSTPTHRHTGTPAHPHTRSPAHSHPSDGGTFAAYLIFWAISGFVIYSWAGEKMPWLTVHITLPFIFLMGHVTQAVFNKFDWGVFKRRDALLFAFLLPLLGAALLILLSAKPFQGKSISEIQATSQFFIAALIAAAMVYGLWRAGRALGRQVIWPIVYLVVFIILSVLTIRFAVMSSFVNYDYPNEFLVYAHGAPDVKWMLDEIDDISRRTVGDDQIKVAYGGVIWPLEWYMRKYPNRAFYGSAPNRDALDAPLVIVSPDSEVTLADVEPYLGDNYQRFDYRQVWWPIEDYRDESFKRLWYTYVAPAPPEVLDGETHQLATTPEAIKANRKWLWDVLFYHRVDNHSFNEWPFRTQMYFFVRKDVLEELWDYQTGAVALEERAAVDPYAEARQDLPAQLVWGSNGQGDGQFVNPRALTVSPQGQIYVADSGNHRVQVFDQNGNFLKQWGGQEGPAPGQLTEVWGIAVSKDGKVYVSDTWNHRVQIFDEDGHYLSEFGLFADTQGDVNAAPGSFWGPRDILLDRDGNLYVSDTGNKRVQKFTPDGQFLGAWGGGGITPGRFEEPVGLALDADGNIYVADAWNQRVQKFDSNFNFITEWPVDGWDSQNITNKPYIAVDSQNRVFISDPENYRIIVYDSNGNLLGTFGQYGQDIQSFRLPLDLAFGNDDALFVVDSDNNRVMKFRYPE